MGKADLVITNGIFLTMDPSREDPVNGWMSVNEEGLIIEVSTGTAPSATRVVDVGGSFVAPGFVSAHSHLFTSGSRGLAIDKPLYEWIEGMTRYTEHASSEDIYWCTLHGAVDFLNNGITTAYDFTANRLSFQADSAEKGRYVGELRPQSFSDSQFQAKLDSGIRFIHSVALDDSVGSDEEVLDRLSKSVKLVSDCSRRDTVLGVAISGSVQWAESRRTAQLEVEAMRTFGIINQPHFLETSFGISSQQERFTWYKDAGALGPDLIFGHFIHTTDEIVKEAAEAGCAMVWQPTSNARLASGIADIPAYLRAGLRVGVGLDDQSCTDISDPWQNLRMGLYLLRASTHNAAILGVREMLELHTLGSAKALNIDDRLGSLSPGKFADFLVVNPRSPDTGPIWDPWGTYVLACGLRNLKQVWIGGKLVSSDGVSTIIDQEKVSEELHFRLRSISDKITEDDGS